MDSFGICFIPLFLPINALFERILLLGPTSHEYIISPLDWMIHIKAEKLLWPVLHCTVHTSRVSPNRQYSAGGTASTRIECSRAVCLVHRVQCSTHSQQNKHKVWAFYHRTTREVVRRSIITPKRNVNHRLEQ